MAVTIYHGPRLTVRYSSVNGELWFALGRDEDAEKSGVLDLYTDELRRLVDALCALRGEEP